MNQSQKVETPAFEDKLSKKNVCPNCGNRIILPAVVLAFRNMNCADLIVEYCSNSCFEEAYENLH
jgi:hypothetical protein